MERKLSRRNILGAAGALAGGSALAGVATGAAPVIGAVTASDGDTLALSLFRQWIAAAREYDRQSAAGNIPAGDLLTKIEDRIFEVSGAAVALAIKAHFWVRNEHGAWTGETALLRIEEAFADDPDWSIEVAVSVLRDAAAIVPEICELAAPVVHEDAALIDAQIVIQWARDRLAEPVNPRLAEVWGDEWPEREAQNRRDLESTLAAAMDRVANTEAKTARGWAVKAALGFVARATSSNSPKRRKHLFCRRLRPVRSGQTSKPAVRQSRSASTIRTCCCL